jgi:HAE1 family hydrophobic/amphiphilic exporter-1
MTAVRRLITILMLSLAAAALSAQETQRPRATETPTAATDQDASNPRAVRLTLNGALNTALQQNLGVQLQTYEYQISGENLRATYGVFDWYTDASIEHSYDDVPTSNPFVPSTSRATTVGAGLSQTLPTGGDYRATWNSSRTTSAGGGEQYNPRYGNGFNFAFKQPLLRDFGIDITRRSITIARNNLGITEGTFRTAVMDTVRATEQAYLDLVYARRAVDVVKESLFLARDQARITQIRIDVGASAPLDILQPRVTIATSEEQLIAAVASVRNAEDRLRALLNLPTAEWDRPIIPADDVTYTPVTIDFQQAVQQAYANRPELTQQRLATDNARVQALYPRNQILPADDRALNSGLAGLSGRREVTENGQLVVHSDPYFDTFSQIGGLDFPSWSAGVNFALPILNINARANARAAELDLEQSRTSQAQTQQNIAVDVRTAARAVDQFAQTIAATRAAREAAEQNVEAERKRYENGMTTNFQVLEVQQQLSDARVRELQAIIGYNNALSAFHRAVGDILEVHGITLKVPETSPEPTLGRWLDRYNWLNYGSRVKQPEGQADEHND